jgi:hypothetical protein
MPANPAGVKVNMLDDPAHTKKSVPGISRVGPGRK